MYIKTYTTKLISNKKALQTNLQAQLIKFLENPTHIYHTYTKNNEYYLSTKLIENEDVIESTGSKLSNIPKSNGKILSIPQKYIKIFDLKKRDTLYLELHIHENNRIIKVTKTYNDKIKENKEDSPLRICRFETKLQNRFNMVISSNIIELLGNPSKLYYLEYGSKHILTPTKPKNNNGYKIQKVKYNKHNTGTINIHNTFYAILKENNTTVIYLDLIQNTDNARFIELCTPKLKTNKISPKLTTTTKIVEKRNRIYFTIPSDNFRDFEKVFFMHANAGYYICPEMPNYLEVDFHNIIKLKHENNNMNFSISQSQIDKTDNNCSIHYYDIEGYEKPLIKLDFNNDGEEYVEVKVSESLENKEQISDNNFAQLEFIQTTPTNNSPKQEKVELITEFDSKILKNGHQLRTILPKHILEQFGYPSKLYHIKTLSDNPQYYLCDIVPSWSKITYQQYKLQRSSEDKEIVIPKKYHEEENITTQSHCHMKLYQNSQISYLEIKFINGKQQR